MKQNLKIKEDILPDLSNYSLRELLEYKLTEIVDMVKSVEGNHNLYKEVMRQTESVLLKLVMAETNTQLEAAQILGINRNTLRKKINDLELK